MMLAMMMLITTVDIQLDDVPRTVLYTLFSSYHKHMRFCRRNSSLERFNRRIFLLANEFLPVPQGLAHISPLWVTFPFPLHLLHPRFTLSLIILKPVVVFLLVCLLFLVLVLVDTLGDMPTHQFGLVSLAQSTGCVSGCGFNTLQVSPPNTGQSVGILCMCRIWSRPRHLLNCTESDFCLLPSFRSQSYFSDGDFRPRAEKCHCPPKLHPQECCGTGKEFIFLSCSSEVSLLP